MEGAVMTHLAATSRTNALSRRVAELEKERDALKAQNQRLAQDTLRLSQVLDANAADLRAMQAERVPLTDERIGDLADVFCTGRAQGDCDFARAIERAHGISQPAGEPAS
jgi:hypothetical protein